jgi:hypothetical protein
VEVIDSVCDCVWNKVLRRMLGPKKGGGGDGERIHNEEFHNLFSSFYIEYNKIKNVEMCRAY